MYHVCKCKTVPSGLITGLFWCWMASYWGISAPVGYCPMTYLHLGAITDISGLPVCNTQFDLFLLSHESHIFPQKVQIEILFVYVLGPDNIFGSSLLTALCLWVQINFGQCVPPRFLLIWTVYLGATKSCSNVIGRTTKEGTRRLPAPRSPPDLEMTKWEKMALKKNEFPSLLFLSVVLVS